MEKENGSMDAIANDPRLRNFNSEWSLKYVKMFRAFAKSKE